MKSKVRLSSYCRGTTITHTTLLTAFAVYAFAIDEMPMFYTLLGILLVLLVPSLFYAPREVEVGQSRILVKSYLRCQKILLRDVMAAEIFMPTMGATRVLASGGFLGYWGIFREGDVGRYVAYYGKSSDCFMVRMKNGDKYVLGCDNPQAMVEYINSLLK